MTLDLVDVVQRLMTARMELKLGPLKVRQDRLASMDWRRVGTISEFAAELFQQSRDFRQRPDNVAEMKRIAASLREIANDLRKAPRCPSEDDLVARYVSGEIELITVLAITGWDWDRLSRECKARKLPQTPVAAEPAENWLVNLLGKGRGKPSGPKPGGNAGPAR